MYDSMYNNYSHQPGLASMVINATAPLITAAGTYSGAYALTAGLRARGVEAWDIGVALIHGQSVDWSSVKMAAYLLAMDGWSTATSMQTWLALPSYIGRGIKSMFGF